MHKRILLLLLCLLASLPSLAEEDPRIPELTAKSGSFPKNQRYEVYEGPGQEHHRAGSGKAVVSTNGEILVYGTSLGRMMIEYELSEGRRRIGWIDTDQLPDSALAGVPELPYRRNPEENVYGVVTSNAVMTDDPMSSRTGYSALLQGTSVRVHAKMGNYYLVEGFFDKELRMGFIRQDQVNRAHGYVANPEWLIDQAVCYNETDIQTAFDAVAQYIYHDRPGTGLLALRYIEAQSADPNAWWQDDEGRLEGICLFADLSSMMLYDYEIAGYGIARDYLFILYREPGGEWAIANWGYT